MQNRLVTAAAAVVVAAGAAGCAEQAETAERNAARVTVDGNTRTMDAVSCTQVGWLLTIDTTAGPARARVMLRLEGDGPSTETINLQDIDGFYGVAGHGVGNAEATFADNAYTITGTAEGSNPAADPGKTRTANFRIEADC